MGKLWIDDERKPPDEYWDWAKSWGQALAYLGARIDDTQIVSFDHDLGERYTGYDLLNVIERWVVARSVRHLPRFEVHSANPVGYQNMLRAIDSIEKKYEEYSYFYPALIREEKGI